MKAVFHPDQKLHYPRHFLSSGARKPNPEQPARADALLQGACAAGLTVEMPGDSGLAPVAAVHSPEYIGFLKNIHARWQRIPDASEEVVPNIHPDNRDVGYPKSAVGQVGYHIMDTSCPISADTFESARWSANTAVHAAELVLAGETAAYALCRPPGHHAFRDLAGGFCYFNNTAIAAQWFRGHGLRPAIVDVDLHHGNGTQGIFYSRNDVLTVSVHADPIRYYPFFWGHANERGEGDGIGCNLNLCFLNNAAIAADHFRRAGLRPAILDVDVHHGNGTQGIFYDRADVLTVSIHADPMRFYPFFWGHAHERGEGAGLGFNLNLPLPRGTDDSAYLEALGHRVGPDPRFRRRCGGRGAWPRCA
jgi:acetoin utilization deacetylase AcuC-like enzyme